MDGVYNHVSLAFPYPQLYRDPAVCPFTAASFGGTFPGLQDLDFAEPVTGQFIGDVCRYWIDTFGIDGIRFSLTSTTGGISPAMLEEVPRHRPAEKTHQPGSYRPDARPGSLKIGRA